MKKVDVVDHPAIEVPDGKNTKTIALRKIIIKIPRGTEIGKYMRGLACIQHGNVLWRSGKVDFPGDDLSTIFYEDLQRLNYNVVGDPNDLFEDTSSKAELVVGGLATGINLNVCYPLAKFGNFDTGTGSATIDVEWQVHNALDRKTVFKHKTHGAANVEFSNGNMYDCLRLAFSNALQELLANKDFFKLVSRDVPAEAQEDATQEKSAALAAYSYAFAGKNDATSLKDVTRSVVTVQVGSVHGSGFVVSGDGLVITNRHVVTDAQTVRIVTSDGRKFEGTVLARDTRRDVAAIAVNGLTLPPLKIRKESVTIGDEVYAVGSPVDLKLYGTVTKGIISSFRVMRGKTWLQSDATINSGNSGGPLVDAKGNVVGISTLARTDATGIYFFGPILDAFETLGLTAK